jgi:hypothetical protein
LQERRQKNTFLSDPAIAISVAIAGRFFFRSGESRMAAQVVILNTPAGFFSALLWRRACNLKQPGASQRQA